MEFLCVDPRDHLALEQLASLDKEAFGADGLTISNLALMTRSGIIFALCDQCTMIADAIVLPTCNPEMALLFSFAVSKSHQRMGKGKHLMELLLPELRRKGWKKLQLTVDPTNDAAVQLYMKAFHFRQIADIHNCLGPGKRRLLLEVALPGKQEAAEAHELLEIRPEKPEDIEAIRRVHQQAFPGPLEARLVDLLRAKGKALISLVAVHAGVVKGHILFSPVTCAGAPDNNMGIGLAPVAVLPEIQKKGLGKRLIEAGLHEARHRGFAWVVVLGDPAYYRRFGFLPAHTFSLGNEYGANEEFMALELLPEALTEVSGLVQYAPEFAKAER